VVEVAWQLFYEKIKKNVEWESDIFQGRLSSKLKLYSPADEDKILLLRKTIIIENEKLESLNNELFKDSDKFNMDLFYPLSADEILSLKFVGDWILTEDILEFLKFDLFKGAKICINGMPEILFNIQDKIDGFFETEHTQIFFEIVAHTENILYLKNTIEKIENENILECKNNTQEPVENILSEIMASENNFWKGMDMKFVITHFKVLTERKNKAGTPFLSNDQFISFLKRGFLNDTTEPKQKVNCMPTEKGFVILRFYDFYKDSVSFYMHPNKKEKFINLFTNCFDNWQPSTVQYFFKNGKTLDKW
jgi:hypothetical protein